MCQPQAWTATVTESENLANVTAGSSRSSLPIPYYLSMTGSLWPGGTERLDLGTAVSHVRRADCSATRVWSAFLLTARRGPARWLMPFIG